MNNAFRMTYLVCILLVLGCFIGCGDDDATPVVPVIEPPDDTNFGGSIGIYADAWGTNPKLQDTGGVVTFYVVHKTEDGGTASSFSIEAPAGWTRLGAKSQFPVALGNVDNGVAIGYGQCMKGAIHVMTLTYQSPGNTNPGAMFRVRPHTEFPENIQVVGCDMTLLNDGIAKESPVIQSLPPEDHEASKHKQLREE